MRESFHSNNGTASSTAFLFVLSILLLNDKEKRVDRFVQYFGEITKDATKRIRLDGGESLPPTSKGCRIVESKIDAQNNKQRIQFIFCVICEVQ